MEDKGRRTENEDFRLRWLRKTLSFQQLFFISFGSSIGLGWLYATLAASSTAGPAVVFSWIIATILVIFIPLNYPRSAPCSRALGGWSAITTSRTADTPAS